MKLMVVDGNSILNRAYYGIRPLSTREGLYTHAVYGFITTLQRLLDEEEPEALCVTFDRREPTFRHQADADYKAQRKPMPPELAMQLPVMKQVLAAMSVPCYELAGYEADDLIGTISRKCQAAGWDCVIVTGDKDSLQLITDRTKVKLVSTRMGQTTTKDMTPETFREQYGFDPVHMIDLKALMGDTSDNIPGVPGVGEKTAMALVQEYGTIDEIYRLLPDLHAKPAAIRKLTIETMRKLESEEQSLSASRSAFESVQATSKEPIPTTILFMCQPYKDLNERTFALRLAIQTSGDKPSVSLRIVKAEQHNEEMANELAALIGANFSGEGVPVLIGAYAKAE